MTTCSNDTSATSAIPSISLRNSSDMDALVACTSRSATSPPINTFNASTSRPISAFRFDTGSFHLVNGSASRLITNVSSACVCYCVLRRFGFVAFSCVRCFFVSLSERAWSTYYCKHQKSKHTEEEKTMKTQITSSVHASFSIHSQPISTQNSSIIETHVLSPL